MKYLYDNNYHTLSLNEIINYYYKNLELPTKSVLITFDDCYQSLYHYAYPILKKYNFNATAFVVTGWLNSKEKSFIPEKSVFLTEKKIKEMLFLILLIWKLSKILSINKKLILIY